MTFFGENDLENTMFDNQARIENTLKVMKSTQGAEETQERRRNTSEIEKVYQTG